uniref:Fimbrial-type adhesion domain-containing protein n=1 Tax=Shewanella putrefaciens (strain 200) TaxID=399804 RepID=E6XIM4_SHEP2
MLKKIMFKEIVLVLILLSMSSAAFARCARNPPIGVEWPTEWPAFDTTTGIKKNWNQIDNDGGKLGVPNRVNIASDLIQPIGSVLANGGAAPFTQYGRQYFPFEPEQVLFVCSPDEEGQIFEGYIANRDSQYNGNVIIHPDVPENTYTTFVKQVGWRAKNLTTGKYFSNTWQLRPLTGLDRDIHGRILVKAKNFSAVEFEYIKVPSPASIDRNTGSFTAPNTTNFGYWDPFGFIFFISQKGDSSPSYIPNCQEGDSLSTCGSGTVSHTHIPAGFSNLAQGGSFTSYKGCQVTTVTPSVVFDPISVSELTAGGSRSGKIEVSYNCENGAIFGTSTGQNALGFKVNDASKTIANSFNFKTTGTAVTKLFSENYGASGAALGVGIDIFPKGSAVPMNWLTTNTIGGGNLNGWYQPNGIRLNPGTDPSGIYIAEYDVKLAKLPDTAGHPVTAGTVYATAELLLVVQ